MILITGATGLVGQQLIARLAPSEDIVCLVRPARRVRRFAPGVSVRIVSGDIDDAPTLRLAMHGVDSVVHLAAISQSQPNSSTLRVPSGNPHHLVSALEATTPKAT